MISRLLAGWILSVVGRLRIAGREHTARRGGYILAANHISHFDPPILSVAALRKIDWMAMVELFGHPLVRAWLRAIDTFAVDRARADRAAVRNALRRLERGRVVGMFPEGGIRDGTRSVLGGAELQPGIGALAQMSGAPIIPCVILGSDRFYDLRTFRRFRTVPVWVAFGEPIRCSEPGKAARAAVETQLGEAMRRLASELREKFALTDDDMPQPPARRSRVR